MNAPVEAARDVHRLLGPAIDRLGAALERWDAGERGGELTWELRDASRAVDELNARAKEFVDVP